MNTLCPNWSFCSNHASDPDGRIILVWKAPLSITILHQSRQSLTIRVDHPSVPYIFFTAVYAYNTTDQRNEPWVELLEIHTSLSLNSQPWLLGGDFNKICHPSEHSSPSVAQITSPMIYFNSCLSQLEVQDLRYHGSEFIWSNKRPEDPVAKKLDKALINEEWLNAYPRSLTIFLAFDISDHTPCCIEHDRPTPLLVPSLSNSSTTLTSTLTS